MTDEDIPVAISPVALELARGFMVEISRENERLQAEVERLLAEVAALKSTTALQMKTCDTCGGAQEVDPANGWCTCRRREPRVILDMTVFDDERTSLITRDDVQP